MRLNLGAMSTYIAELTIAQRLRKDAIYRQETAEATKTAAEERVGVIAAAQILCQATATSLQAKAQEAFADIGTEAMADVFDNPYNLLIEFKPSRGKSEAVILFERDGEKYNPMRSVGGGTIDVAAMALRLSAMVLTRPPVRRCLILDEPCRFVSQSYRSRVATILEQLAESYGVQFIIVTHHPEFSALGKLIDLGE
jgi:DNA repair exonuclease SbcCD ATPase subunit